MPTLSELYKQHENSNELSLFKGLKSFYDTDTTEFGFKDLYVNGEKVNVDGKKMSLNEFNEKYKNSEGVNYFDAIKLAGNAQSEDDVMEVIDILSRPEMMDRTTARETYNEFLGYDPTTYWDRSEIDSKLSQFEADEGNPRSLVEAHDEIVNAAMTMLENNRDYTQSVAIKQALIMNEIDEDIVSKFDKIAQSLAVDEDEDEDDDDIDIGFDNEEELDEEEESSIFDDDDSYEDD